MAKSKRNRRAKNNLDGSSNGAVIKAEPFPESAIVLQRPTAARIVRASIFNAEFEEVIEIIAKERVYRAMLRDLERRMLSAPRSNGDGPNA